MGTHSEAVCLIFGIVSVSRHAIHTFQEHCVFVFDTRNEAHVDVAEISHIRDTEMFSVVVKVI